MPIASGLGFVDHEHPPNRVIVRDITIPSSIPPSIKYNPSQLERIHCGLMITTVVLASLVTLVWFVATF